MPFKSPIQCRCRTVHGCSFPKPCHNENLIQIYSKICVLFAVVMSSFPLVVWFFSTSNLLCAALWSLFGRTQVFLPFIGSDLREKALHGHSPFWLNSTVANIFRPTKKFFVRWPSRCLMVSHCWADTPLPGAAPEGQSLLWRSSLFIWCSFRRWWILCKHLTGSGVTVSHLLTRNGR